MFYTLNCNFKHSRLLWRITVLCFMFTAHLAALPSSEWGLCGRGGILLTCALALGRLPGCFHICGQESCIMGGRRSGSCHGYSGLASREWRESFPWDLLKIKTACCITLKRVVKLIWFDYEHLGYLYNNIFWGPRKSTIMLAVTTLVGKELKPNSHQGR